MGEEEGKKKMKKEKGEEDGERRKGGCRLLVMYWQWL